MNLNIEFRSRSEKSTFKASAKASFGNLFSASTDISNTAKSLKIDGSVSISAYQLGGNPSQLARVLTKDAAGDFYVLTCSL